MYDMNILEASGRLVRVAGLAICLGLTAGCLGAAGGSQDDSDGSSDSSGTSGDDSGGDSVTSTGALQLSASTYTVGESDGTVTIPVQRVGGSAGEVTVDYATRQLDTSNTSHARDADFNDGDDYDGTFGTLTFADGVTAQQFSVSITGDSFDNPDLTFEVYLYNPSTSMSQPDVATVSILDDDDPVSTSSATIHWTAPTTRTDGSALTLSQISGYVVYEGTTSDDLDRITTVDDGSAIEVTVNGLVSGVHYLAVSARDTDGLEGPKSQIASFTVP